MKQDSVVLHRADRQEIALLALPKDGCLRVIVKSHQEWHEFDLSDVLVVVLPGHPVGEDTT